MKIKTSNGTKEIVARIGTCYEYYLDSAGIYWTQNPQVGFVSVPATSRALQMAIKEAASK